MRDLALLISLVCIACAPVGELSVEQEPKGRDPDLATKTGHVYRQVPDDFDSDIEAETPVTDYDAPNDLPEPESESESEPEPEPEAEPEPEPEPEPEIRRNRPDACLEFGYYGDGICDRFCLHPDVDCEDEANSIDFNECAHPTALNDGECDPACETQDPDCQSAASDWSLDEGLMTVCSRFSLHAYVDELAQSICIQAPPEHFDYCVQSCLERYRDNLD